MLLKKLRRDRWSTDDCAYRRQINAQQSNEMGEPVTNPSRKKEHLTALPTITNLEQIPQPARSDSAKQEITSLPSPSGTLTQGGSDTNTLLVAPPEELSRFIASKA